MGELNQESPLGIGDSPLHDFTDEVPLPRVHVDNCRSCVACGCNISSICHRPAAAATSSLIAHYSAKRASPEPPSEPNLFGQDLSAFTKISLPIAQPSPALRRCISDPCTPPRAAVAAPPVDSVTVHSTPEGRAGSSSLPPKPPVFRRCVSDPTTSPAKSLSAMTNDENAHARRLRRMKDRLREMNQWVDDIVQEVDECAHTETEEGSASGEADDSRETVSVDKDGECINIRLNCPCKKAFHVLLFRGLIHYKLI